MNDIWARWSALTRSVISIRIATERERAFWGGLEFTNRSTLKIKASTRDGRFTVRLVDHVDALSDEGTLLAASLVLSYALAEAAAVDHLHIDARRTAGIEDWGGRLLAAAGHNWSDVDGGLAGAVEVGVMRNLITHGRATIDPSNHARLVKAGCEGRAIGDPVALGFDDLGAFRSRLRSLLTVGGLSSGPG